MWKLSDILLREASKSTSTTLPHSDFIDAETYPEQITDLLRSKVIINFVSFYKCNIKTALESPACKIVDGVKVSLRPEDDIQFMEKREITGPDFIDMKDYWTEEFTVLRADKVEPFVFIAVSEDFATVIVSSTKLNNMMHYTFLDEISIYGIQYNEFFDLELQTHYMDDNFINDVYYDAVALRIDKSEPCKTVLMEYVNNDTVRFVLGDEVTGIDNSIFDPDRYISDKEIPEYRQSLLEGKIIYGEI